MATKLCRTIGNRNSSLLLPPTSTHSHISEVEWITNIISLIIFLLAFIGNTAALVVMFGSRGPIRLTNNKYLANLACADLLRACFMPFTIIARMKKTFIFGKLICKILPIVQGLSVAVDVFTLVCISIERYLAICRPLLILKLQSLRFANLLNGCIVVFIWLSGLLIALPNFYMYDWCSLPKPGRFKCEKTIPQEFDERVYMVALDAFYFVIPMLVMVVLYTLIIWKMYRNSTAMRMRSFHYGNPIKARSYPSTPPFHTRSYPSRSRHSDSTDTKQRQSLTSEKLGRQSSHQSSSQSRSIFSDEEQVQNLSLDTRKKYHRSRAISHPNYPAKSFIQRLSLRKTNSENSCSSSQGLSRMDRHRRKALKLLITLIVEFFVCWTPLFIYHTIGTFNKNFYRATSTVYVDVILLFSFASASCNPLTYYFMSKRYRSVLYAYLPCRCTNKDPRKSLDERNHQAQHFTQTFHCQQQRNSLEKKVNDLIMIDNQQRRPSRL